MAAKVHDKNCANNNGHGGDGSCHRSSPSAPPKPRLLGRLSQCRRRLRSKARFHTPPVNLTAGVFLRLNIRYLVVLLLLYISGLIACVGPISALLTLTGRPGAVYRSNELFERLWPDMAADNSTAIQLSHVWKHKRRLKVQRPCTNSTYRHDYATVEESSSPSGYLLVEANGGLNQQRAAICNAVAVAGLLNAVLVIPYFEFNGVWRDPSTFADIYDQEHFITTLEGYVKVVKELPDELMKIYDHNISNITTFHVQAWAPTKFYLEEVFPVLHEKRVIRIAPFANRLAMNVPPQIQLLRCIANHEALKFSSPIRTLAQKLVNRMAEKSSKNGGKYISVHLRFEEDMVAFSCCIYDGGDAEKYEMDSYRETGWRGKFRKKNRLIIPSINRVNGKCPLTPLEVGMMLRGMGFDNNTSIYLASGEIYQAERHLDPLLKMFPLTYSKKSLAASDEFAPFEGYSSRLAALDYTVCLFSEVFVTTQGGNFPHFLMGHRRYLFDGHAKTIKPDKRKLVVLLQDMGISWTAFKDQMEAMLTESDRKGVMVPKVKKLNRKTSIYAYPLPECGCLQSGNLSLKSTPTVNKLIPRSGPRDDKQKPLL